MQPQLPVIDVFIGRDGNAWRLYVAPFSWKPGLLRLHMDSHGVIFPVARPDVDDLDGFMWAVDSPYEKQASSDGGVQIVARGKSAVTLLVWLGDLIAAGQPG